LETKDSDLQILKQYQGFIKADLMIDALPDSKISAFELESSIESKSLEDFPFDEASAFQFLGKRAEVFFRHYIHSSPRYQELVYSLQLFEDNLTIGEFDFILEDLLLDKTIHVELVNKIYLFDEHLHENPDFCWIGPNRKDRFIDKLKKLKSKQFPLLYHPEAELMLEQLCINPWKIDQQLCFKAILFLPQDCRNRFYLTNLDAVVGYYYTLDQFLNKKWKHDLFFIPKKINWFVDESQHTKWMNYQKILHQLQYFLEQKQSVMLLRKNKDGETSKCFVVWW